MSGAKGNVSLFGKTSADFVSKLETRYNGSSSKVKLIRAQIPGLTTERNQGACLLWNAVAWLILNVLPDV